MKIPRLETGRLVIRELRESDLEDCHRLYVDIGFARADLGDADNRQLRRAWLEWTVRSYVELAILMQSPYGERAIEDRHTGEFIGLVGLVPCFGPFGQLEAFGLAATARSSPEVGLFWAVSPPMQGRGYAAEAAHALATHALENLQLARIVATTEYDNVASIGVMRKIGMVIHNHPRDDPPWFQIVGKLEPADGHRSHVAEGQERVRSR